MKKAAPLALTLILFYLAGIFLDTGAAQSTKSEDPEAKPAAKLEPLLVHRYPQYFHRNLPFTPEPIITLRFSAPVTEEEARGHLIFRNGDNKRRIPAEVSRPSFKEAQPLQPWGDQGKRLQLSIEHFLSVRPLTPLPLDNEWKLEIGAGLASSDGKLALADTRTDHLGYLYPFKVRQARAINRYDEPKTIQIQLSKEFAEPVTPELLAGFLNIEPKPDDFSIVKNHTQIILQGDFQNGTTYQVSVLSGLDAFDTTRLESDFSAKIKFESNPGFITLPAFTKAQNASGAKRFDILTGNLQNVRVRVKKLDDRDLVYALRGYDDAYEGSGSEQRIPYAMVPGRTIYDQKYERTADIDNSEKFSLHWPKMLDGESHAALYICAEGDSATRKRFGVGGQAIIQLTDIGLAWKQNGDDTLLFAFSLNNGNPLANLKIDLLDPEAETLASLATDENGLANLPKAKTTNARWLAARNGKDRHVIRYHEHMSAVSLWRFSIPYRYYNDTETDRRTLIFTDRPVYRPGDRVYLKCLSRQTDFDSLLPPGNDGAPARIKIRDARNRVIHTSQVTLSEHGSFDDSFQLPEGKNLGWYSVSVDFNDLDDPSDRPWMNQFSHSFQVAEYRPNTFEIAIDAETAYEPDTEFSIPVSAKYFMGKPLSKAQLQWHVSAYRSYPQVRGFEGFAFGDRVGKHADFSTSQTVHLGRTGDATIKFELPEQTENPVPLRVNVNTEITDINQQTVSQSTSFMVDSSRFYLGLQRPDGVLRAGEELTLALAAVGNDSEIHESPVKANLKIEKRVYNTVKVRGAGGRITTKTEEKQVTVYEEPVMIETSTHPVTGTPVPTMSPVTLKEGGDYYVTVSAVDDDRNGVVTRTGLRVFGADEKVWGYHNDVRIDVTPDKESYQVGDTAKLLVRSPILGHALVTTERGGIRTTRTLKIDEHESVIEVPVEDGAAPNFFASVMIIRGTADSPHEHPNTDYRIGYCQLEVEDPATELEVAVETPAEPYALPGSAVEIAALVRDHRGDPVANTEVTLYAVDEGVLSLTGYQTPDPGSVFHAPFPLSVRTGQSISALLAENPDDFDFSNKGYVIGGGGDMNGLSPDRVRKNFKALAFWGGSMVTGPDGRVKASFTAPDNLTTFRVIAVAAAGNRFGSAEGKLVINKPLILEPALPAFSNVADEIDLTAILHNNTDKTVNLEVSAELDEHAEFLPDEPGLLNTAFGGKKKPDSDSAIRRTQRISLKGGETSKLTFPVRFTRMGEAVWNWKAVDLGDPNLADSVESKLEIGYPLPLLRSLQNVTLSEPGKAANALAEVDPKLLTGRGTVRVTLSNSRVAEAMDALDYVLRYPYGCVEQTTSSLLPWLSTRNMREALPNLNRSDEEIASTIAAGSRRLLSMQTHDGGLSYWPGGSESMEWGSAYGGIALALAQKSGANLPQESLDALWKYLSKNLRTAKDSKNDRDGYYRCLSAYTLATAGKAEPAYHDVLYRNRAGLSRDSRSLLALAMIEGAGKNRDDALEERVETLLTEKVELPENQQNWYRESFTTSMELLAWSQWDPTGSRANELIDDLLNTPRTRAAWGSTYLNSWTLMALASHTEASAAELSEALCTVRFGDESREIAFEPRFSGGAFEFEFEGDRREVPLELEIDSSAKIYAHVEVETQPAIDSFDAVNEGFGITRTYHKLDGAGDVHPADKLEVGDLVLITLHLAIPEKERYSYLAIDDPLPSIFEAVNPDFKSQAGNQKTAFKGKWKRFWTHHKELRKDRALFFNDYLYDGGDYAVQYLARVVAPGEATAPPAKIEAMYEPERYGLSSSSRIVARPLKIANPRRVAQLLVPIK